MDAEASDGEDAFDREVGAAGPVAGAVGSIVDQVLREGGEEHDVGKDLVKDENVSGDKDVSGGLEDVSEGRDVVLAQHGIEEAVHAPESSACTAFVRGLPLDATSRQLSQRLGAFGRVTSCRMVRDKAAGGQLKGTAFVEFASPEGAAAAVAMSDKARCVLG